VLAEVGRAYRLVLITKGDLIHQTHKVTTSGLEHHFEHVEIVLEKDPETFTKILHRVGVPPERFCMVGNSVKSDVLPVLSIGGHAVHIPYPLLWDLEQAPHDHGHELVELGSITELPALLGRSSR
jgi:putative hydrolase of the HAD superfamily